MSNRSGYRRRQWKILGNHGKVIHRLHFLFIPARHGFTRRCSVTWDPSSGGHRTPGRRAGDGLAFTVTSLVCAHAQKCACAGASSIGELWWTPWTRALWNAQPLRLSGRLGPMDCYVIRLVGRSGKHCNWQLHPHYSCNVRNSDTGWCNSWHAVKTHAANYRGLTIHTFFNLSQQRLETPLPRFILFPEMSYIVQWSSYISLSFDTECRSGGVDRIRTCRHLFNIHYVHRLLLAKDPVHF